ncbi:MAG: AEC family transporter, partial [Gammaproteobacteria bacterium]|nr:AEC family transporter [Gammaproteobacteria bacterium]
LIFDRSLKIATGMTLPLALLAIGGGFSLEKLRGDLFTAALASVTKTIWLPIFAAILLSIMGVKGVDLGIGVL